ncbi:DUF2842 domain-containing protein [Parasedimentitalea psychrophila]|uniref:DUF2842 domain-containing protein n=1 Tax=Parasedimentitalea psychrophila TaxID=2997337 RepID=A0A9Y2P529_9RHOB|nr:DUF2842 domain-containing protein [Parasedimentitalea psychrophila]WIY23553.1 DUF2842 domain-containing protein [Parasedimentitalea psychrophila]
MAGKSGLSYKARRRWSLVVLLVGLPLYIIVATTLAGLLNLQSVLLELVLYGVLGIVWILPFKSLFRGIGQADPDAPKDE